MSPGYSPVPLDWDRLDPEDALSRSREFMATMDARRSVRLFSAEPVPRELIDNALTVAGTAPSGAHQQPWTFAVVSDQETKAKLREAAEKEERDFYERRATDEWKEAIEPIGTDWVKTHITDAPYVIVVFEQPWRPGPDGSEDQALLRARVRRHRRWLPARGAPGERALRAHPHAVADGLPARDCSTGPENERPFILIPVGYPADDAVVPDLRRKPLDEFVERY